MGIWAHGIAGPRERVSPSAGTHMLPEAHGRALLWLSWVLESFSFRAVLRTVLSGEPTGRRLRKAFEPRHRGGVDGPGTPDAPLSTGRELWPAPGGSTRGADYRWLAQNVAGTVHGNASLEVILNILLVPPAQSWTCPANTPSGKSRMRASDVVSGHYHRSRAVHFPPPELVTIAPRAFTIIPCGSIGIEAKIIYRPRAWFTSNPR